MSAFNPLLLPRNGGILRALIVARISTQHQDRRSLEDQIALCEKFVQERYTGTVVFVHIQGQGSGEFLDRKELAEAEAAVETRQYDLVIVEDIGRICRRNRAIDFCEQCQDSATRLISINDSIDTCIDGWRLNAFFATFKHESGNADTAKRIRRSLRNRFEKGGVVQSFPPGYIKKPGAKSDDDVVKDPNYERSYDEWFRRLEARATYCEIADFLNAERIPGPRGRRWTGRMVARVTHNPILKGYRRRNERMSQRVNKTGRRRSVKAPTSELLLRHVPHLQFIEPTRYDRVISMLDAANAHYARGRAAASADTRLGVSRKRTVWPGQHVVCGVCGRLYYWGGHGQTDHMMCAGAREYECWNAATFDGCQAGRRIASAVLAAVESLPEFDDVFRSKVEAAACASRAGRTENLRRLDREHEQVEREIGNVVDAIAKLGFSSALQSRLAELENRKTRLGSERADLTSQCDDVPVLPSINELKDRAREAVGRLPFNDPRFGRLMHDLVPRLTVFPCQSLDGGAVVLRANVLINLASLTGSFTHILGSLISTTIVVDLFDPSQRIAFRERVVALRSEGKTERVVANELGLTVTAVQRAMVLHRMMFAAGLTDPYRPLIAPLNGARKFRRHLHSRYKFQPRDGYPKCF